MGPSNNRSDKFRYPVNLEVDGARTIVSFVDFPEVRADGETEREALANAGNALEAHLAGVMDKGAPIPPPSRPRDVWQHCIRLPSAALERIANRAPDEEMLQFIEQEYRDFVPKLEIEMKLEHWEKYRRELLKALQLRRRQDRDFARRASELNAMMLARGADWEHVTWEETIGRRAYGEIFIRLQLYRADIEIAHLKAPGSKRRMQGYRQMEGGAIAAFEEERQKSLKVMMALTQPGDEMCVGRKSAYGSRRAKGTVTSVFLGVSASVLKSGASFFAIASRAWAILLRL